MDSSLQIVTHLPLAGLWDDSGKLPATRKGELSEAEIVELLRHQDVRFVLADVGYGLRWVPTADTFRVWKEEVKAHVASPGSQVRLEDFPGERAYWASLWIAPELPCIVVLEKIH